MKFCEYKNAFGKPNTGAHSVKIYNIAIIDFLITFVAAYFFFVIGKMINNKLQYWKVLLGLFLLGIYAHYLFCVPTPLNTFLGLY